MPIYEYKCNQCGHITEFLEKRNSKEKHLCEKCGSLNVQKVFSTFSTSSSSSSPSCPTGTCPLS